MAGGDLSSREEALLLQAPPHLPLPLSRDPGSSVAAPRWFPPVFRQSRARAVPLGSGLSGNKVRVRGMGRERESNTGMHSFYYRHHPVPSHSLREPRECVSCQREKQGSGRPLALPLDGQGHPHGHELPRDSRHTHVRPGGSCGCCPTLRLRRRPIVAPDEAVLCGSRGCGSKPAGNSVVVAGEAGVRTGTRGFGGAC